MQGVFGSKRASSRAVRLAAATALAWFAATPSARACLVGSDFLHAVPASGSTLPSGEVYVALAYSFIQPRVTGFRVENELGADIPVTFTVRGDALLLQLDTTGSSEVTVFELFEVEDVFMESTMRAMYDVSPDAPDPSTPTPPAISLGEVTCDACPPHLRGSSCCSPARAGQLSTKVTFLPAESDTILGWLDADGQVAGVITRTTYESADGYVFRPTLPPEGASIVAMSVAGVMSAPVTWAVEESGPCEVEPPDEPDAGPGPASAGKGCAASPAGGLGGVGPLFVLGLLLCLRRRRAI
jgi:hypothetical protein